jgi:hypothetical protein
MNLHDCWRQTASPPKSKATKMDQGFKPRAWNTELESTGYAARTESPWHILNWIYQNH